MKWMGTKGRLGFATRNVRWVCDADFEGQYVVRHCLHPTANHPWFTHTADGELRTFRLLKQAKDWVEDQLQEGGNGGS